MSQSELETLQALNTEFRSKLPSGLDVCVRAMGDVLGGNANNPEWIKANFSLLVEKVQITAYEHYLKAERPAAGRAFRKVFGSGLPATATQDEFFKMLEDNFWAMDKFFLSLTQGRRPRAGNAFEHVIKVLFNTLKYPYSARPIINGQPDFLLPSHKHYKVNPMDCIIFTVKRTLRERWRQITTEGTKGHQFFLATIDEGINARDLPEMLKSRIYLVVPETIRTKCYPNVPNVISFEGFFSKHLDPAMARWRADGVIKGD